MTSVTIDRTDGLNSAAAIKGPCRAATTANITLSGEQTIDGVAVVSGDRVLVKDQTDGSENGLYVADTGPWRRSKDFNKTKDVVTGTAVYVTSGTMNGETLWVVATTGTIVIGTTSIEFSDNILIPPGDIIAWTVPTRPALKALNTVRITTAYLKENGREGIFEWNAGDFSAQIAADTQEGLYIKADAVSATSGAWVRVFDGAIRPKWFGAVADGTTDDSAAISAAGAMANSTGKRLTFPSGHYRGASIALDCDGTFEEGAYITFNGATNGYCIDISGSNREWGRITAKGNSMDCSPVQVTGSGNKFACVSSSNVTATASGNNSFCGVRVLGDNNKFDRIFADNFVNAGHSNGSFPQSVLFAGTGNTFDMVDVRNGQSGVVLGSGSGTTRGVVVNAFNMVDNGIYQLGGDLALTTLNYQGNEEPVVFIGSASVGTINVYGSSLGFGMQSAGRVSVGRVNLQRDASGNSPSFAFRTRPTSSANGELFIGAITGEFEGSSLFEVASGNPLGYLSIATMEVTFIYDAAVATSITGWADMRGCGGFNIGQGRVQVVDKNSVVTSAAPFQMQAPSPCARQSFWNNLDVVVVLPDKTTVVASAFRGVNFAQQAIFVTGAKWRTDIGPYIEGTSVGGPSDDSANQAPVGGTWIRGKRLLHSFPAASGVEGWVCVTAGTPGTWKTFGSISA